MRAPIEHEQAYTPPPDDTDTIAESASESEALDVGEQTTSQPQPATAGAR